MYFFKSAFLFGLLFTSQLSPSFSQDLSTPKELNFEYAVYGYNKIIYEDGKKETFQQPSYEDDSAPNSSIVKPLRAAFLFNLFHYMNKKGYDFMYEHEGWLFFKRAKN